MENGNFRQEGFHSVTAMLTITNAKEAIGWYKKAFGAKEVMRLTEPNGNIAHAEIKIGDSIVMLAEENPAYNQSPKTLNGTSIILSIYVPNVDEIFNRAVNAGASTVFPVKDQFYGDRSGRIQDPFGHMWIIATAIKHVSADQMQVEFDAMLNESNG
jgi:PhnB protein